MQQGGLYYHKNHEYTKLLCFEICSQHAMTKPELMRRAINYCQSYWQQRQNKLICTQNTILSSTPKFIWWSVTGAFKTVWERSVPMFQGIILLPSLVWLNLVHKPLLHVVKTQKMANTLTTIAVKTHIPVHKIYQIYAAQPRLIEPQSFTTNQAAAYRDFIQKLQT